MCFQGTGPRRVQEESKREFESIFFATVFVSFFVFPLNQNHESAVALVTLVPTSATSIHSLDMSTSAKQSSGTREHREESFLRVVQVPVIHPVQPLVKPH